MCEEKNWGLAERINYQAGRCHKIKFDEERLAARRVCSYEMESEYSFKYILNGRIEFMNE